MRLFFFLSTFFFTVSLCCAQIDKIDEELEKDKKNQNKTNNYNNNSSSSNSGGNGWLLYNVLEGITEGIYLLQKNTLENRKMHREIVSLEAFLNSGYDSYNQGILFTPQGRLNWGIFSTEFRQQRIFDGTGILDSYDWQVLKFNIPVYPVTFGWGMGFTKLPLYNLSYFEYSLNGKGRIIREKGLVELAYRSTSKVNNRWFRREFKTTFDYELKNFSVTKNAKIRISPMIGFVYQNYFASFNQFYIIGGINLRFW